MSTKLKWERINTGYYRAVDASGREWKIDRTYGGGRNIYCDGKYVTDTEPPQALAEAKRIAAERAANYA